jgi:hypothetical protein
MDMQHMKYLKQVALHDVAELERKEKTYQGSWKRRGGVGASMMMLRKADRLEQMLHDYKYDIFERIASEGLDSVDGTAIAEVRDLRRYLLLIEAEMVARSNGSNYMIEPESIKPGTPEDGGHHAEQQDDNEEPVQILERLEDGLKTKDIPEENKKYYITAIDRGMGFNIVNRNKVPAVMWEHLPRIRIELNNKEHDELPREYRGLYTWLPTESKWLLLANYQANWGK